MPLGKPNPTIHGNRHVIFSPFFIAALLVCSLILTLPVSNAFAAQATLAWTPNTEADLAGYRIYYGTASDAYPWYVDVGDVVTYTIDGLDVGMNYYFSATAYDTANLESDYSNEVIHNTCTYGISPSSAQFTSPAATGTISILTQNGCASSASSSVSWVSITSGASGTGARNVVFSVSANTTTQQRSGNLTVANQTFVVTQEGAQAPVTYSLTASAGTGGTISPAGSVTVTQGASQTFTISAASGYQIDDVKVDGTSVGAVGSYTFSNVTAAHTIAATFKAQAPVTYSLTASAGTGGTISPAGSVTVTQGASQTFTISAASGYQIDDVKVDGTSVGAVGSYTFSNVTAAHTIAATFKAQAPVTYSLTASAGTGGTISPAGSVTVTQGASQTFTISAASGYQIDDVKVDGTSVGAVGSYTFSNVTAAHTIAATFKAQAPVTYSLTASAGTGGTISPAGSVTVTQGASQTFTISAASGYQIDDVKVDGTSVGAVGSYTFSNVTAAHTIAATFKAQAPVTYSLTASAGTGGTISPAGSVTVTQGASQTFTISAASGYQIDDVKVDGTSVGAVGSYTFSNVTAAHTIAATFKAQAPVTYSLTASAGTGGTISPAGSVTVTQGASQTFTISAASGYQIDDVKVDGTSVGAVGSYTFSNVTAAHTIAATFKAQAPVTYSLTASAGTGGTISPAGSVTVTQGASQTFTISAASGYQIDDVKVDGTSVGAVGSYTFSNVTAAHTIAATFKAQAPVTYSLTASAGTGGTISPAGSVTVTQGASQTFTISAASGYQIDDVKVDGTSVGAVGSYTFSNVTAAHTIAATFKAQAPVTYSLTASAGTGGTISPAGSVTVTQGASQTFTISAASGYQIDDVKVDGTSVGAVGSYTFSNVTAAHTIAATFKAQAPVTYSLTASAGTGGTISPAGSVTVTQGASQTFTISAASGYQIDDVKVDGTSVGAVGSYTFSNVTAAHTIAATFKAQAPATYTLTIRKDGSGSGAVSTNPQVSSMPAGTSVLLTATPNADSVFSGWSGGCSGTDQTCSIVLAGNTTVTATFTLKTTAKKLNITALATSGGYISPAGFFIKVYQGSSKTFTITPRAGYVISDVKVNNTSVGPVTSYTFTNIQANQKIVASFKKTGQAPAPEWPLPFNPVTR